jgi:ATP-dependent DNA helicase RecG
VKIIEMIREDPTITISKMAESPGKTKRAVEMQLAKLRDSGAVKRIGSARGGRWEVREDQHG